MKIFNKIPSIIKRYNNLLWKVRIFAIAFLFGAIGCRKMIEVPPPSTSINSGNVFALDATAVGAVNSLYGSGKVNISEFYLCAGLLADEVDLYVNPGEFPFYYQNALNATMSNNPWSSIYYSIFTANSAIDGLNSSSTLTPSVKQQLLGETKFVRAYLYFYLINLYGDVPLVLTTDPEVNRLLPRSAQAVVYAQIEQDLKEAQGLLSKSFLNGSLTSNSSDRVRPTYWAATALLARVYLYERKFSEAISQSSIIISNSTQFSLPSLNDTFLKNSSETIWALQPLPSGPPFNTPEGANFVLPSTGPSDNAEYPFYLSNNVVNAFEKGDARKSSWIGTVSVGSNNYAYANKYKADRNQVAVTEYEIVLRLAEQYLIRAEANARLGNVAESIDDLNVLRTRARAAATVAVPNPLPNLPTGLSQVQLYVAIEHERQVELFTEFGHRWLDLKRTPGFTNTASTRADELMPSITEAKGGSWSPNSKLYPIPFEQLLRNPNMINDQNPGYN